MCVAPATLRETHTRVVSDDYDPGYSRMSCIVQMFTDGLDIFIWSKCVFAEALETSLAATNYIDIETTLILSTLCIG